jgi:ferredoxin
MAVRFLRDQEIFDVGDCLQGLNLLGHAQMIELFIGSKCGGHGECGGDRIRIKHDDQRKVNAPTEIEKKFLSRHEIERGMRIACQCFPNEDGLAMDVFLSSEL